MINFKSLQQTRVEYFGCFYKNLFDPVRDSKIIDGEFLTKEQ